MKGTGASAGVATGAVYLIVSTTPVVPDFDDPAGAFAEAATGVKQDLEELQSAANAAGREEAAEILAAQSLMAEDPMLAEAVVEKLDEGEDLGTALNEAADSIAGLLAAMEDEYLAARSADVLEIADRIRHRLAGTTPSGLSQVISPVVVVAETLTAADTAQLDPDLVLGFITEQGGPTSHVAVIARSLGIPAVVGAIDATATARSAETVAIDGGEGDIVFNPQGEALADFSARAARAETQRRVAMEFRGKEVQFGGQPLRVAANVGGSDDVERAVEAAADGVGLYRTEFLFLDRDDPPTEDEQYQAYAAVVAAFAHPVVIRTLDIGGDKPAPYLDTPEEENPFLGERGVRLYARFPEVFAAQARALLRAATEGDLWIMLPMVATVQDLLDAKDLITAARDDLASQGIPFGSPKIGVMIEVPSAALNATALARHADFFSIGTNDLTQYTLAADRMNGRLSAYSDAAHPAVLSLCATTAEAARAAGISVAVCGAAAVDPVTAALFAAMGMDKLSVVPPRVNLIKAMLDDLDEEASTVALSRAVKADSAAEVRALMVDLLGDHLP